MKKILLIIAILFSVYGYSEKNPDLLRLFSNQNTETEQTLKRAFEDKRSDIQVSGSGVVIKLLHDDTKGSRHQKFILKLSSGQTILVSHNIDLAPRIDSLTKGDTVFFYGEYEWNSRGGVVHWTHHDPRGNHADGWLKHNGVTYQ